MKDLKAKDLRDKSVPELEQMVLQLRAELFKARRDLVFRQNTDTSGIKTRRHNMARVLTVIGEKKRGGE
jgi:large subunit ribosomal protein L29